MRYATKQRKRLLELLERHRDEALSADEIADLLGDEALSRSAIYRNLAALEGNGLVKRMTVPGLRRVSYRYVGSDECREHLHLECSKCGRTFHLDTPVTDALIDDVLRDSDFQVDRARTVLYGVCGNCQKK
ncbi:MAG: transcriptional repressor [Oscillospiraceae bacterium]|nr:transcriptional repressor [Oscillospiraceae bacterium]